MVLDVCKAVAVLAFPDNAPANVVAVSVVIPSSVPVIVELPVTAIPPVETVSAPAMEDAPVTVMPPC